MSDMTNCAAPKRTLRWHLVRALRERDRLAGKHDRTKRLRDLIEAHGQRDWGHRLMTLVGREDSGSWGPPRGRDLYIRDEWIYGRDGGKGEQRRQLTQDGWEAWQGAKRGESWRTFDWQDDGTSLRVGWLGADDRIHDSGIQGQAELQLFRRWLIWDSWAKAEWFGLRRWLYYKGLHHAVDHRDPFSCGLTPPPNSGDYSHWHCDVRRPLGAILAGRRTEHAGPHRYRNYQWAGGASKVQYDPQDVTS